MKEETETHSKWPFVLLSSQLECELTSLANESIHKWTLQFVLFGERLGVQERIYKVFIRITRWKSKTTHKLFIRLINYYFKEELDIIAVTKLI